MASSKDEPITPSKSKPDIGVVHEGQDQKPGWTPLGNGYKREIKMLDQ